MFGLIYIARNILNGKIYIGQTTKTLQYRKSEHYNTARTDCIFYFHKALRKSPDWFRWEILGYCSSKEELDAAEKDCIQFFQSTDSHYGYNLSLGGTGNTGQIGKRKGVLNSFYGKHHTKETRLQQRLMKLGKYSGSQNPMYGKTHNNLTRLKLRQLRLGKKSPLKGRKLTNAVKKHISEIRLQRFAQGLILPPSEEHKQKLRKAFSGGGNPSAKTVIALSPENIVFIIKGEFNKFCHLQHVDPESFRSVVKGRKSQHAGWQLIYL